LTNNARKYPINIRIINEFNLHCVNKCHCLYGKLRFLLRIFIKKSFTISRIISET